MSVTVNNKELCYFDIETTGLAMPMVDDLVCFALLQSNNKLTVGQTEESLKTLANTAKVDGIVVTYNGEHYYGGFDFPWLRMYCIQNGLDWMFEGVRHLDLSQLVKKRLNTKLYELDIDSRSSMKKADLVKLCDANGLEYQGNKKKTYKMLMNLHEEEESIDWLKYAEEIPTAYNDLQNTYQMLCDPEKKEEYLDGGKVPDLYQEYLNKIDSEDRKEQQEAEDAYNKIVEHNKKDVKRLKKVAELVIPTLSQYDINRALKTL